MAEPKFVNDTMRRAHQRLDDAFSGINYEITTLGGDIPGVALRDADGRYLFAWHTYQRYLLFYLRGHALRAKSTLRQTALASHEAAHIRENNRGETLIELHDEDEAQALLGWLLPRLPLPHP